jgi:tryptophanyl-tRNA synthetase
MTGMNKVTLTGIKPTGRPHLGNYVGMIRPTLELFKNSSSGFLFIANYHALNSMQDPKELHAFTYDIAATMLAFGLDPEKVYFYRQSDIPQIFELAVILASITPKGLMDRAHAYKASIDNNRLVAGRDEDDGVNMGLYTYPILMAADILLFNATTVPVGRDQIQHIEFARDIAGYFNRKYHTDIFYLPEAMVQKNYEAIVGLDGRKMSKSYGNTIPIFETSSTIEKLVRKVVTDSKQPDEKKDPDTSSIFLMYSAVASPEQSKVLRDRFENGTIGYGEAKKLLARQLVTTFERPSVVYSSHLSDRASLDKILARSAKRARAEAEIRMQRIRAAIGV